MGLICSFVINIFTHYFVKGQDFGVYISTTKIVFSVEEFSKHVKAYIPALRPNLKFNDPIICGKV